MRELRYVKQATDGANLILESSDGAEEFLLGIDVALRDAVRSTVMRRAGSADGDPKMGPREIQVRVRSGESPQDLADSSGTSLEWIMRFATPVLAERTRISDEARRARARRSSNSGPSVVFGETVDRRLTAYGVDASAVVWDAYRREDGQWIVSARWSVEDSEQLAEWSFQLAGRTVTPIDEAAADLLSDRPIRPAVIEVPEPLSLAAAPRLAPGLVAFPDLSEELTGRIPVVDDELFDQAAFSGVPAAAGTGPGAVVHEPTDGAADADPAAESDGAGEADEPLPLHLAEKKPLGEKKPRRAPRRSPRVTNLGVAGREGDSRSARPEVPSWDDILLGVRRKQD